MKSYGYFKSDERTKYIYGNDAIKRNEVVILLKQKLERSLLGYKPVRAELSTFN